MQATTRKRLALRVEETIMTKQKPIRVLLVDDELDFLRTTSTVLERRGFRVSTSSNGQGALSVVNDESVDVVVLDVKMPDVDGHELFYKLRDLRPDLPVIMLTGHGKVRKAFELSRNGVSEYLAKPCDIDELARAIRAAYEQSGAKPGGADAEEAGKEPAAEPIRVLFIDDDEDFLVFVERIYRRFGFRVLTARDGREGLDLVRRQPLEVVVLDIELPGLHGSKVLSLIKKEKPLVEVILLTGYSTVRSAVEGLKQGAFDYVTKPQDNKELARKIREAAKQQKKKAEDLQRHKIEELIRHSPD